MRKLYLLLSLSIAISISFSTKAQVTGVKNIPGDYSSLSAAISALNTTGVGAGGATINIAGGYTETAPSTGFVLGSAILNATLSAANPLTIKKASGANPVFTAQQGTSTSVDGIFKIQGADYVTIDGLTLTDPNTGLPFSMEWGFALVNLNTAAPFDGCQYVTIKNCTITLNRLNPNGSFGIYSAHHTAISNTSLTLTSLADAHSNNKFYNNNISNVNEGIWIQGYGDSSPFTLYDQNNDVGGSSAATGNTLTNLGGNPAFNIFGIALQFQNFANASYNTFNNAQGGVGNTTQTLGIYTSGTNSHFTATNNNITLTTTSGTTIVSAINSAVTGPASSNDINNNTISFVDALGSGPHYGIFTQSAGTLNANGNTLTATTSGPCTFNMWGIYNNTTAISETVTNNNFLNYNVNTTGGMYMIYLSNATTNKTISGNTVNNFNRPSSTGVTYCYYNGGAPGSGLSTITNNTITNVTVTGFNSFYGLYTSVGTLHSHIFSGNIIDNWSAPGSSQFYGIYCGSGLTNQVFNNSVTNLNSTYNGVMYGIYYYAGTTAGCNFYNNKVSGISNAGANLYGVFVNMGTPTATANFYKNTISDITSNGPTGAAFGLSINTAATVNIYNNIIGNIYAPATNNNNGVIGINLNGIASSVYNVHYNSIYLKGTSSGVGFGSSGIFANTTPTVTLRNNLVSNLSIATGTSKAAAYRRSSATLTTYGSASNNNMWYSGGSSANAIYFDGTTAYATLPAFQTLVAPRDANSVTEPGTPFLSTVGTNANFLHLNTTIPTVVESGGTNIASYTDDYDGDTRNATTPDIGADEFLGIVATGCNGTPTPGTISGSTNICLNKPSTTLTVSGFTAATGISIQWQKSATTGGPYTDIAGATGPSYFTGALALGTYYYVAKITCANGGAFATTPEFALTVNNNPTVTVSPSSQAMCVGGSPVSMTANGAATYTWSPASGLSATTGSTVNANPNSNTTYTVTGTSAVGCSANATATVVVNMLPIVTAVANPPAVCLNGTTQLQAYSTVNPPPVTGAYTMTSLTGETYAQISGPGITIINSTSQLTPGMGSTTQDDGGIVINLPFTFTYMSNTFTQMSMCTNGWVGAGNWGTIDAVSMRLNGNFFQTTNPNNTLAIRYIDMGANFGTGYPGSMRHGLIGTDVYAFQWDQAVGSSFGNTTTNLISFMIKIYGPASTNPGRIEYIYGPQVGSLTVGWATGIEDGVGGANHYLNVVDGTGTSTTTVTSWPGTGNGYRFDPVPATFTWTPSTNLSAANIANPVASNLSSTTTYTVTATANGCNNSTTLTIPVGTPLSATAAASQTSICSGSNVTISASPAGGGGPFTYSWSNGSTVVSTAGSFGIVPASTTIFTVTVTDACSNTATASVTVTVNAVPTVTVTPTSTTLCSGSTVGLSAAGAPIFIWSGSGLNTNSGANVFATPNTTTTYTVTGYTTSGCTASATTTVNVYSSATVTVNPITPTICNGGSTALSASGSVVGGYLLSQIPYNAIPTPGSGVTTLSNNGVASTSLYAGTLDDGDWINQSIGFNFNFYGLAYSQFTVSTNGFIVLGTGTPNSYTGYGLLLPSATAGHPCVGAMYADLDFRSQGTINYFVTGTAPNRMLVINWSNGKFYNNNGSMSTQAILYEGTDVIEVHTFNSTGNNSAVEGIQNATGTVAVTVPGRNSATWAVTTPDAYRWSPPSFTYTWYPMNGLNSTTGSSVTANPSTTTTYTVIATEGSSGCKAASNATVLVNQNPAPAVSPANPTICNGDVQQLTVTSNSTGATKSGSSSSLLPIPDSSAAGVNNSITISGIPAGAVVTDVQVSFRITHTNDQDLIINLKGPNGQVLNLVNARGGTGDNFTFTTISSAPNTLIAFGTAPFTGVYSPDATMNIGPNGFVSNTNNFTGLYGAPGPNGIWTLAIQDANGGEVGALTSWSINIHCLAQDNTTWSPATNLYTDAAATIAYAGTNLSTVYAKPTTTTTYTVTGNTGCSTGTGTVMVNVNQPPAISNQPTTLSLCQGQTATFTVGATGAGLAYQWYFNNAPISNGGNVSGANSATLSISNIVATDAGNYYVVVSGSCNPSPVTSTTVTLSVGTPPLINSQPQNQIVCAGNTVSFSVVSPGTNSYQWYKGTPPSGTALVTDGVHIFGATSPTLTITNITAADAGNYYVVVTNGCNFSTTSVVGVLTFSTNDRWLGVANSDWNNPNNWCNGVPTPTTDVEIPSGTLFPAILSVMGDVRNLQINSGASLAVTSSGWLNIWGSTLTQNGTFNTSVGTISFRNTANLNVPAMSVANLVMNGAGGITINGTMKIDSALTLTNGNITLGSNNLLMQGGTLGSVSSHIVTNGTGAVTNNNIGVATVVFPIGPGATNYNPLQIANGQGLNYTVRVATGVPGTLNNATRAINRTWTVSANTSPASPVQLTFNYADADGNGTYNPATNMEAGYFNGSNWIVTTPSGGVNAMGVPTARQVYTTTSNFGMMVVSNVGGLLNIVTGTPNLNTDIFGVKMLPNIVNSQSILRVNSRRAMNIEWTITDLQGKVVMKFNHPILAGQNDITLKLGHLASGSYQVIGYTDKGTTDVIQFVRL